MSKHFTHLHLHTEYSLLDGAIGLDTLIKYGKKFDFKALAITDHGNVFGGVKFFQKCKKAGIKPILGMEAYFTEDAKVKNAENKYYHLILLVENQQGYKNLCALNAYAYQEGFYFKPRIDYDILKKHSEGLIVTSACLGGHIPKLLQQNNMEEVDKRINWFIDVFGRERFYLEVQPDEQNEQKILNAHLFDLSKKYQLDLVAAGDCHYPSMDDHEAHEVMLAIQTHDQMDNPNRYTFGQCRVPIRSTDEMLSLFKGNEDAVWNAGKIADRCSFDFETNKLFFPKFAIPEGETTESYFTKACKEGLIRLKKEDLINAQDDAYDKRLELEINMIINMGFVGYFLVVSDFIQWAYKNGIPVGPGRGSAAGSLVAWTLQITNIDPLKYNLLFERFLNPERVSWPDIDIDFCIERREEVIQYICQKYGHENVCHIITFGTMMAKGAIKDVARALGFSFEDSNAITSLIPDQLKITLTEALEQEPRLKELIEQNPKAKKMFDIAFKLEGLTRHASKHAAGIVISPEPVAQVLPLYVPPKTTELVAQYGMSELEYIGFLKIDLLGLKNLTLIDHVIKMINSLYGVQIDINKLPLDDPKTFALLCQGKTSGVFQLESDGLKDVLRKLQPDKFEDIIAVNALYRPGPLGSGMVDDFVARRHGRQKIVYLFDELAPILQETYGVIVYQEQVMKIASTIGGYSLGEADILRRAMGKKKPEEMQKQESIFVERATQKGFDSKKAKELFDLMAYFAGYGFNKSHSAAYALIAYQTAYLKANYPAAFMACLISLEADNAEKMAFYIDEAKHMHLEILPPDINRSHIAFTVVQEKILFGLQGIKSVGLVSLQNIIEERQKNGPFTDLLDFCKRIDLRAANKRVLEHFIFAGACDGLPGNRAQKYEELGIIIEKAITYKKDCATGQMGLFQSSLALQKDHKEVHVFESRADWPNKERLAKEKETIGFYVSAHPLDAYQQYTSLFSLRTFEMCTTDNLNCAVPGTVTTLGSLKAKRIITTKKGERMCFVQCEDKTASAEIIIFPKLFAKIEPLLDAYHVFIIKGEIDSAALPQCKIKANAFVPVELVWTEWPKIEKITVTFKAPLQEDAIVWLKEKLPNGTVPLELFVSENDRLIKIVSHKKTSLNFDFIMLLNEKNIIDIQCIL